MYTTARINPLSLTYFHYCLENGSYNVSLHFAEIIYTNDGTYNSLGNRMFDVYVQEILVLKDFNIAQEARGIGRPLVNHFNATVHDGTLEIRFYWGSKGTTRIPNRGDFGSLVSAISAIPNFKVCLERTQKNITAYIVGSVVSVFVIFLVLGIICWRVYVKRRKKARREFEGLQIAAFSLKQIKAAMNFCDAENKIGEGGLVPCTRVYYPMEL